MLEISQIILAYILADALSGIYHLVTDLGYNIPSQVRYFQKHHEEPWTMTFDLQPLVGSIPLVVLGYFYLPWFFFPLSFFIAFAQIPHYYVHHSHKCPFWMKWLQKYRIVIGESHNIHHSGNFDKNFCILSGWNDWWLNPIASKLY